MITVKTKVFFSRSAHGRKVIGTKPAPKAVADPGRIPRVSRLVAVAIHFDRMVREGRVGGLSELARLTHVTQPRMTQIMNLRHLAPDILEELLFLPRITKGRDRFHEHMLRPLTATADWRDQRRRWEDIRRRTSGPLGLAPSAAPPAHIPL